MTNYNLIDKIINVRPSHLNNLTSEWFILEHNAGRQRQDWRRGGGPEYCVQRGDDPFMRRNVMRNVVIKWRWTGVVMMW